MSSKPRQSGRPSSAQRRHILTSQSSQTALPAYQPPAHSLNPAGQRALDGLHQTHSLRKLQQHQQAAHTAISDAAYQINERYALQKEREKKAVVKRRQSGSRPTETDNRRSEQTEEMRESVEQMTIQMEEAVRKLVDAQRAAIAIENGLSAVSNQSASQVLQNTQSQRHRPVDADGDDDMTDFDPTDPAAGNQSQAPPAFAPSEAFRHHLRDDKQRYQSRSYTTRYAENNDYKNFRRLVWAAQHPSDDPPPMPNANTWFPNRGSPAPGTTMILTQGNGEDADSDDDMVVMRSKVSTKCPLTLMEFSDPVSSLKCPHTFERSAITSLIEGSDVDGMGNRRRPLRNQDKAVRCPVPGCSKTIMLADLHADQVIIRQIRRVQDSRNKGEESDEDEGAAPESVDGNDEAPPSTFRTVAPKVESSARSRVHSTASGGAPPRSTQVIDLGGRVSE
ncbi:hypothetical protein M501DRAFT_977565 [Patellaria atrata CBS 101060]|uniref:SP-RING-type domain-containing protein n=1 Tax=Patellaria atrata CBS 101060 TaxID=1346257 RepID=A0A9P4S9A9_9PEZI|nr:hypothetical protein M501DRAFT_977565 [Patellaria atrata CBS 101060]